jgi:hypothetical protein
MKIYQVQVFDTIKLEWLDDLKYDNYEDAKKRCIEIVGTDDYYSEPFERSKYITPPLPFEWNGTEYENKETGEKRQGENKLLFRLKEGYFAKEKNDFGYWDCRIYVINE